jgi:hypothetical protein
VRVPAGIRTGTGIAPAAHIQGMATRTRNKHPELLCIVCSGGKRDPNGAYTVCALCVIEDAAIPAAA